MEKFLLSAVLTYYKLNIINQQNVDGPVFVSEFFLFVMMNRIDDFVGEIFTGHVKDLELAVIFHNVMGDRVHQMGFSQSGAAV